jgi:uracil-DNA glycosylase
MRIEPQLPVDFCGLAIIGECPGQEEVEQGKPFVGRSGRLLDTVLEEVGIVRADCLVTNVFLSRPPSNKIDAFFRSPTDEDAEFVARYGLYRNRVVREENRLDMSRLDTELSTHRPMVVLLLGATALWRIGRTDGITAARGSWSTMTLYGTEQIVAIMATWHPSAVLRSINDKLDQFVGDIKAVKDMLDELRPAA